MTALLSVYILTLNSERRLAQVLDSVQALADEIVVVDSGSSDRTHEISHAFGARVLVRSFDNFCNQRVFAEESCAHPWVLALDSDEVLSPALQETLRRHKAAGFQIGNRLPDGYSIRREWFFLGRQVRTFYPVKAPDYTIKLFQRSKMGHRGSRIIHESIQCDCVTIFNIHDPIFHYSCDSIDELYGKMDLYTRLAAADMNANGVRSSWLKVNLYPWLLWARWFLVNGAWKDGEAGRILCKYARDTVYLKYLKLKYDFSTPADSMIDQRCRSLGTEAGRPEAVNALWERLDEPKGTSSPPGLDGKRGGGALPPSPQWDVAPDKAALEGERHMGGAGR